MRFVLERQDARLEFNQSVPNASPFANPMDRRLGYLQLGGSEQSPLSERAGRQDLMMGLRPSLPFGGRNLHDPAASVRGDYSSTGRGLSAGSTYRHACFA